MAKKGMTYEEEMAAFSRYADAMHAARPRNQAAAWKDNPNRDADLHRHAQRIQRSGNKLEAARAAWERIMAGETPTPAAAPSQSPFTVEQRGSCKVFFLRKGLADL